MSLELKLDLQQITRISSHDDDPDEYFRTHYKHSSTIGGEKVDYAFASRAALLRWGDNEWGYASQGDVVIVSKHLQPELSLDLKFGTQYKL